MPSAKYARPAPNLTPVIALVTAAAAIWAAIAHLPAGFVVWLGVLVMAWMYPAPNLTGTRGAPANDFEERQQEKYRSWIRARGAMVLANSMGWESLWPGIPVRLSWVVAVSLGVLTAVFPLSAETINQVAAQVSTFYGTTPGPHLVMPWWMRLVSGAMLAHTVAVLVARSRMLTEQPAVRIPGPAALVRDARLPFIGSVLLAPLGAVAGHVLASRSGSGSIVWGILACLAGAGLVMAAVLSRPCTNMSLATWRLMTQAREEWTPVFENVFAAKDGTPRIVSRTELPGGGIVDEMDAPSRVLLPGMLKVQSQLEAEVGDGAQMFIIASPQTNADGNPIPGTVHAVRLRIVRFPEGTFPDLLDPNLDSLSRDVALECAMAAGMDAIGFNRLQLISAEQVADLPEKVAPSDERSPLRRALDALTGARLPEPRYPETFPRDSAEDEADAENPVPPSPMPGGVTRIVPGQSGDGDHDRQALAVWKTVWGGKDTPSMAGVQASFEDVQEAIRAVAGDPSEGVDIVVERRDGFILIGNPLSDDTGYTPESGLNLTDVRHVVEEVVWERRWEKTLQQGANPPTARFELSREASVPRRFDPPVILHEQLFASREGLDAGDSFVDPSPKSFEKAMAAAIPGDVPFCSFVSWPKKGEGRGTRHKHFFLVRWSEEPVPRVPQDLMPQERGRSARGEDSDGSVWVLAHLLNQAFTSSRVKLPKPELASAECLTTHDSSKHVWKATLVLYGGTTLGDVRAKFDALRSALGAPWMRVQEADSGKVTLYMGDPESPGVRMRRGKDKEVLNVDFEQAWIDSSVVSRAGLVPELIESAKLASNPMIDVLDFMLPSGLDFMRVRNAKERLTVNLNAEYVDIRPGVHGAASARIFTSKEDPLPKSIGVPWDSLEPGQLAFATNALGEKVSWDAAGDGGPHLLLLGASGSGKEQPVSTLIPVPIQRRHPSGWAKIKDLRPGDLVFDDEGNSAVLDSTSTTRRSEVMVVHTDDGQSIEAGPEHLWEVETAEATENTGTEGADNLAEAVRLRNRAARAPYGQYATREDIAQLAEVPLDHLEITGACQSALAETAKVAIRRQITHVPVGEFTRWLTLSRRADLAAALQPRSGTMSVREIAEAVHGGPVERAQVEQIRTLVAISGLGTGHGGYDVREMTVYPVTETMMRLADWHEHRALTPGTVRRTHLVTTVQLREMVKSSQQSVSIRLVNGGIEAERADLPVPPYVVGHHAARATSESDRDDESLTQVVRDLMREGHLPAAYLRASRSQRLHLLRGLLDEGGKISAQGEITYRAASRTLIGDVQDLARSLGIRVGPVYEDSTGVFHIVFTTNEQVFTDPSKAQRIRASGITDTGRVHVRSVERTGRTTQMRCLRVRTPRHMYLTGSYLPTHNSVTMRTIIFSAMLSGFDVVVIDPTKGGLDFGFCREHAIAPFGTEVFQAASILRAVYGEAKRRKELNTQYGVENISKLPDGVRPRRMLVAIDEFTSLMGKSVVPEKSDDPEIDNARLQALASNDARAQIGSITGNIAREARSFGIHLLLGTQKLSAKTLDSIPGAGDLRTNLARAAQGNTSQGDRMSAFRNPMEAEQIKQPHVGRGLFEPLTSNAFVYQSWYDDDAAFAQKVQEMGLPLPTEDRMLDPDDPKYRLSPPEEFTELIDEDTAPVAPSEETQVEEIDVDVDFGDLGFIDDGDDDALELSMLDDSEKEQASHGAAPAQASSFGADPFEALEQISEQAQGDGSLGPIEWDFPVLDDPTPVGGTYRELIDDLSDQVTVHLPDAEYSALEADPPEPPAHEATGDPEPDLDLAALDAPEPEVATAAPEPAVPDDDDDDDFSFGFAPPTRVMRIDT